MVNLVMNIPAAHGFYSHVQLTDDEIEGKAYQELLGGGEKGWKKRGAFQLFFLQRMGLQPSSRLLDIGCGPLRAGSHLINFLDRGKYHGVDYNADFIRTARKLVAENPQLRAKRPAVEHCRKFGVSKMKGAFDYLMIFSVLNHCPKDEVAFFFDNLHLKLHEDSRAYVSHARWFKPELLEGTRLRITRRFDGARQIAPRLNMHEWGWENEKSIFPILEIKADPEARSLSRS